MGSRADAGGTAASVEREAALVVRFYGPLCVESSARFQRCLSEAARESAAARVPGDAHGPPVIVLLQSDGGDVFAGLACLDAIDECCKEVPVVVVAEGVVASAATFLLLGARRRMARPNALFLVHQASTRLPDGEALRPQELRDEAANAECLAARMRELYAKRTKLPPERVEELLQRGLYLDATAALAAGLVHEIVDAAEQ